MTNKPCTALSVLILLAAATAACSKEQRWNEEALLSDGKSIVVERRVIFDARRFEPGQSKTGAINYSLRFKNPANGQEVRWENAGKLEPMIVDLAAGIPYVVAVPVSSYGYVEAGCPNPAYFFFKYTAQWDAISYEQLPKHIRRRNLLSVYVPQDLAPVEHGAISSAKVSSATSRLARRDQEIDSTYRGPPECVLPRFQGR